MQMLKVRDENKTGRVCYIIEAALEYFVSILVTGAYLARVTGALGFSPVDPTIGQICQSISLGAISAMLLVVFVLPGMLSALDRGVMWRQKTHADTDENTDENTS